MQAIILAGGEGTRLRPLTQTVPKPVLPLVDRPLIAFMFEWLRGHGVDEVVLCCGFLAASVERALGDGSAYGVRLRCLAEPEPRGTGGALKYAQGLLDERFVMLNGDVLTDLDLTAQLAQHARTAATGTLALVGVEDPSAYGLVRIGPERAVTEFLEKPSPEQIDTNLISAGAYVLERSVLQLIPAERKVSIEREVWPALIGAGLFGWPCDAYWLDVGTPERYLQATYDIIEGRVSTSLVSGRRTGAADGFDLTMPAVVDETCRVEAGASIGSHVVLGPGVRVGAGARIERAVVMAGGEIGADCVLADCIVGPRARIGARTQIGGGAVLGDDVEIGADNRICDGARIEPGVRLPDRAVSRR